MLTFQLRFEIDEGNINTFLIGSKSLFENIESIVKLLGQSIDVETILSYKLIELESDTITYLLALHIEYPMQMVFGHNISNEQIDTWFKKGLDLLIHNKTDSNANNGLSDLANEIGIDQYFIYIQIPADFLIKLLDDFEKLSILLFNKLVLFEK